MIYYISRAAVRVAIRLLFRFRFEGMEHVPESGPVIVCSNHRSLWDPPFVGSFLKRQVHFMAKAELFKIPILGSMIRSYGALPVNRGGLSMEAIKLAIKVLKQGKVLAVFPEGTRQTSDSLGSGKKGAASLALRSGAKVLPVAIIGSYRWFSTMHFICGEAIDLSPYKSLPPSEQLDAATQKIMDSIKILIEQHETRQMPI